MRARLKFELEANNGNAVCRDDGIPDKRVVVIQTWKRGRLYDYGNYIQSCKALLDSLSPEFLVDDSPLWCIDYYAMRGAVADNVEVGTLVLVLEILAERTIDVITWTKA